MYKPTDMLGVAALDFVNAVKPVADATRAYISQSAQAEIGKLVKDQLYQGKVIARLDSQTFVVNIGETSVKMALGSLAQVGQNITLKYLGNQSNGPSFSVTSTPLKQSSLENSVVTPPAAMPHSAPETMAAAASNLPPSNTSISNAAQLIQHYLQANDENSPSTTHEASSPISAAPNSSPQTIAQDLKHALTTSGLFYESHLAELVEGKRPLAQILQEPQNQLSSAPDALVPQQLNVLENQKLVWHGEAWPNQMMTWEVWRDTNSDSATDQPSSHTDDTTDEVPTNSRITLSLPNLGAVTAQLSIQNNQLRINIQAADTLSATKLKNGGAALISALKTSGQAVDFLSISHHEKNA